MNTTILACFLVIPPLSWDEALQVANVTGRAELLAAIFYLLALMTYVTTMPQYLHISQCTSSPRTANSSTSPEAVPKRRVEGTHDASICGSRTESPSQCLARHVDRTDLWLVWKPWLGLGASAVLSVLAMLCKEQVRT